jgi:hypothetical protein
MRPTGQLSYILATLSPRRSAAFLAISTFGFSRRELRALCAYLNMASSLPDKIARSKKEKAGQERLPGRPFCLQILQRRYGFASSAARANSANVQSGFREI